MRHQGILILFYWTPVLVYYCAISSLLPETHPVLGNETPKARLSSSFKGFSVNYLKFKSFLHHEEVLTITNRTHQRNFRIRDLTTLSKYEFERDKNIACNKALFQQLFPEDPTTMLGMNGPPLKHSTPVHSSRSSPRITTSIAGLPAADPNPESVTNPQLTTLNATDTIDTAHSADAGQIHNSTEALHTAAAPGTNSGGSAGQTMGAETGSSGDGKTGAGRGDPEALDWHTAAEPRKAQGSACAVQDRGGDAPVGKCSEGVACAGGGHRVSDLQEGVPFTWPPRSCQLVDSASSQRPVHPHCDDDHKQEDFYEEVVRWWVGMNPGWRKTDLGSASEFGDSGLKQESGSM
ncbi:hypothetical protein DFH08DRAFT_813160 [Mycena albidolilacea]|uniref:Uncharacterized protein n=1 Tax=Mycena albidolilacea TaxID=1033008 RepID=A0AAD6ZS94_9AGAR|nr:hypothetical protein DFH08DRAFT_813160 [Mycena albidolilacea]